MHKSTQPSRSPFQQLVSRCSPGVAVFLATLLALPVNAGITLPNDPLTTASRIPPNVLFILDDSGSMAWHYMYNPDIASITGGGITSNRTGNASNDATRLSDSANVNAVFDQYYVSNTVYYNPNNTYQPWLDSTGTPLTGGTTYGSAYDSTNFVTNTDAGTTSGTVNLAGSVRTYYTPKAGATNQADATQLYRFQIRTDGRIVRSERLAPELTPTARNGTLTTTATATSGNYAGNYTFNVPANSSNLVITTSGGTCTSGSAQCANVHARFNANPDTGNYNCRSTANGNAGTCTIASPSTGEYRVRVYAQGANFANVTVTYSYSESVLSNTGEDSVGCDTNRTGWGWRNCTYARPATTAFPSGRTEDAEKINFATWYSYHRTRTKAAKAGASSAFAGLGTDLRVGFRTIWGRNHATTTGNMPTQAAPIPVQYNNGLFDNPNGTGGTNNNRAKWYSRLFAATATSGTPLKGALQQAGIYFSGNAATGAYGPEEAADQYACRQNFAILTTDGYWNDNSNYTTNVNNADGTAGTTITSPTGTSYTYSAVRPFTDSESNTLADVAMYYWKTDLRTDTSMTNIVPTTSADPAFWQHMVTFGISIGLKGTLNPDTDLPGITAGTSSWPTPVGDTITTIDDLWHAAVNGHGTFLAASNPNEFTRGLANALASVTQRTGSFSNVSANSTRLDTDTRVYQATYVSGVWTGELYSYEVDEEDGVNVNYEWRASDGIPDVPANRNIVTHDGTAGATFPTAAQVTALERTVVPAVSGADNAAYIRGETSREIREGGTLRNRNTLLGDIVSSSPTFVADTGTLYVGANDGMLHAFDAEDGAELFGYIPRGINLGDLSTLSNPSYAHRYFVDGPTVVSNREQTPDQNILVGTLGKGGKGVFALDVTSPADFDASDVLWEDNETPGGNMGLVQGRPVIAKLNDGTMALIVSNGINSSHDRAVLLVYELATGTLLAEIDTGAGATGTPNGLAAPVGWDADANGTLDSVYAGDLLGNVWKFDLSSNSPGDWEVANSGAAMFTATRSGVVQPITGGLTVALDPKTYKTWVFFGTGRMMTAGDLTSASVQSLYGLIDLGSTTPRTDLTARTLQAIGTREGLPVRGFQPNEALPADSKGWYVDLLTPPDSTAEGERVVSDAQIVANVLVTSSVIPTADACETDGKGYLNAMDAFTGTSLVDPFFDLDGDGDFTDETLEDDEGNPVPVGSVNLGVGMPTMANLLRGLAVVGGSSGGTGTLPTDDPRNVGRVSWREARGD
ncbi:MAG: pilus assembly protein [Lysobacteraceae bacterium]|nr:MAG: pilus assembly protein [Xanthomonadaceae bacterium]